VRGTASAVAKEDLSMLYRTPFQPLQQASEHVHYMQAMLKDKGNLPYGLDIWHNRKKVMLVEWNEGEFQLVTYKPGEWELMLDSAWHCRERGGLAVRLRKGREG
jgi:hypothetical protein